MAIHPCAPGTAAASGRAENDPVVAELIAAVEARIKRKIAAGESPFQSAQQAAKELAFEKKMEAAIKHHAAAQNAVLMANNLERIRVGHEAQDLRALATGIEGNARGLGASASAQQHALVARYIGGLVADMRRDGLLAALKGRDRALDLDVSSELWRIQDPGKGVASGNPHAVKIAANLFRWQEIARAGENAMGGWVGKLEHYITRQSHDMYKVRGNGSRAAMNEWIETILPRLDDQTFEHLNGTEEIRPMLENTWRSLASGIHETHSVMKERKLFFKSGKDWYEYNEKFGKGGVIDAIEAGLIRSAHNTALMGTFGTGPEQFFARLRENLLKRAKDREDFRQVDLLQQPSGDRKLFDDRIMDVLTGKANIPAGTGTLAKIGSGIRNWEVLTKLGGVVLSSLPDLQSQASMLRWNGVSMWESYGKQIQALFPGKTALNRERADTIGVGIDAFTRDALSRYSSPDQALGSLSNMVRTFYKWNLLTGWTDSMKYASGLILTNNLGRNAGREFGQLNNRLQITLRRYGIEESEWNAMRGHAVIGPDGAAHLLPEAVADRALSEKLQTYVIDQVREGITEPRAIDSARATGGTQPGTLLGEGVRLIMQFKSFTITFMGRSIMREFSRDGVDVGGVAQLIAGTTLLGYASWTLKDIAKGRDIRRPEDAGDWVKILFASLKQGGGMGIYGDFLFGEANRMGGGFFESLLGPTFGTIGDAGRLFNAIRDAGIDSATGERIGGNVPAQAMQFAKNNTPFVNLFYTRAALDYLILFSLQEAVNPGFLARYEARMKRENNQTFWLSPRERARVFE